MVNCEPLEAYRQLEEAELVGCWAYVRRKFFEAPPKKADKSSLGAKGLAYCDQLFFLERDWELCQLMNDYRNVKNISSP
ncbi:hypothetical protein D059_04394 [Streptococcus pneumoniae 801]|nr:hypothetical protein D059_04394 [Streptococcus pneumoniae 801]